jgi:structure-specific endonuclease subunit SLX4 (BTB/POZ domain-containing protein 12)
VCENEEHVALTSEQTENAKPSAFDDEVVAQKLSACPNKYIENLKNNFKAPQATTPKLNNKSNDGDSRLTSPLTPMPSYTTMNTPILKNQLKTFGLKVLPRKQAVKKLVEIYEYTHRKKLSLIKSKSCSSLNALIDSTSEASNKEPSIQQAKSIFKPTSKKGKLKKTLSQTTVRTTTTTTATAASESVPCSQGDAPQNDNLQQFEMNEADVLTTDCLNESEIKLKIKEFLLKDEDLHTKILNYEPLEFDKIYTDVKQLGFKISNKLLMRILDEFCITFTLKNIKSRVNKAKSHKKY